MVADEVVETPYIVCKTIVLTVELLGNNRHISITSCIELHKDKMHAIMQYIGFEPMSLALLLAL